MKQYEAVHLALERNGGFATLGYLYHVVTKMPEWQSSSLTPFASIRRIVQETPGIFRIRPGLWGLEAKRAALGKQLALADYAPPQKVNQYSHSYYQGLLVEIGNFNHLETAVPAQDKNKPFLNRKLFEVTSLAKPYEFTFSEIMGRARTIDVSWYNARHFPQAFYEVEHSTDIYNSLLKFVEFQDFRTEFWIVADKARKAEFEGKMKAAAFSSIAGSVKFLSYDKLSEWHTSAAELAVQERQLS